jgi:6-pyruvoyltetrahydropterin/6-carboxytetrahydropterin synthase
MARGKARGKNSPLPGTGSGAMESREFSRPVMPYRICKSFEIENGHMLSKHPDKCRFPHGHTRKVEFVLEADELDEAGMVCDFKLLKEAVGGYLERFDHALCMNTADPMYETFRAAYGERVIGYADTEPTTEVLARDFFQAATSALAAMAEIPGARYPLRRQVRLVSVRVWETSSSWAEVRCS